jgi:hypothetical protein
MNQRSCSALALVCAALLGCASTTVETTGAGLKQPLCQPGAGDISVLVYWGPQWRPDQKEPTSREAAALSGIQEYFASTPCASKVDIRRIPVEQAPETLANDWLLRMARSSTLAPDSVILIVVRELGPRLIIGIPAIVEGGTEVVIDVRVLDVKTSETLAEVQTRWRNGGKFVIKGVKSLAEDMSAALRSSLPSTALAP